MDEHKFGAIVFPSDRVFGFPEALVDPLWLFRDDQELKAQAAYRAAKAGDAQAAVHLVGTLGFGWAASVAEVLHTQGDLIFVAPHASEASGDNAIPQVLATLLSFLCQGKVDEEIVQSSRVFLTGADAMERMVSRASFEGEVVEGGRYVLVDDVMTLGGTLADLSNFIQIRGGTIQHVAVLVNAGRIGQLRPGKRLARQISERYGDEFQEVFGIGINALTADEANYVIGFRSLDEIRGRAIAARQETRRRLRAKGILIDDGDE